MAEIKRINGQPIVDYMARDYDSLLRSMRELIPHKLPEWTDYESEADFGNVLLQLFAHMGDILSYYQDRVANESFLGTAQTRRSIIHHLRLIGYRLATAAPAAAELTLLFPADCTGTVTIRRGDAFATKSSKDSPSVRFEYNKEDNLAIDCDALETYWRLQDGTIKPVIEDDEGPESAERKKVYIGVPVEEGRLIVDEYLGLSDGTPNQTFPLAHAGLILRSLGQGQAINRDIIVMTQLGETKTVWTLQESLAFSRDNQRDFTIEIDENDTATLRFGDGAFGAIPQSDAEVRATYRVGGGVHGNVPKETIQTIVDAPQLSLLGTTVTNPNAAVGGAERESIEHAVEHAPAVFRTRARHYIKRAVTAEDYKALALDFSGVGKVRAEGTNCNTVTLFVAPEGGGLVSDLLEANLLAYFEDKRLLSTTIEIQDVDYVAVHVTVEIGVVSYYSPETVKKKVESAGGELLAFENVDFGQTLYLSKFYEAIEAIEGVAYANITEFRCGDSEEGVEPTGKIMMDVNEIPVAPEHPDYAGGIKVLLPEIEGP